jgi:hypothetical protein
MKFHGNEAGDKFLYLNGGIWSHGNAWYALDLIKAGRKEEAQNFIKKVMTIDGMLDSPNGQPAMYEVRNGNYTDPKTYGKIDKPQFMWAAGWYLYCLYHLYGIDENSWNISFSPFLDFSSETNNCFYNLFVNGKKLSVLVNGKGKYLNRIKFDKNNYPSLIVPAEASHIKNIELTLGNSETPYLTSTNSILENTSFDRKIKLLKCSLRAFAGHNNYAEVLSPYKPKEIFLNEKRIKGWNVEKQDQNYLLKINFSDEKNIDELGIQF